MKRHHPIVSGIRHVLFIGLVLAIFVSPLVWMFLTSLKSGSQIATRPEALLPVEHFLEKDGEKIAVTVTDTGTAETVRVRGVNPDGPLAGREIEVSRGEVKERLAPQWGNYGEALREMGQFRRYLGNTLWVCFWQVLGQLTAASLAAYGFAILEWKGRDKVFALLVTTMMIPFPVLMIPQYDLFRSFGWLGTLKPLWVPALFAGAFNVFLLRQFFLSLPKALIESARLDGCSELRILWSIVLPLSKPVLTAIGLFTFLFAWNDFLGPLIFLTDKEDYTLSLALQFFQSQHGGVDWNYLMAASAVTVAPILLLFFVAQKFFVQGVSMSGMK